MNISQEINCSLTSDQTIESFKHTLQGLQEKNEQLQNNVTELQNKLFMINFLKKSSELIILPQENHIKIINQNTKSVNIINIDDPQLQEKISSA